MRARVFMTFTCIIACCCVGAQTGVVGNEQYDSYDVVYIIDNLARELIPESFICTYYDTLKPSDYTVSQHIDKTQKRRDIIVRTNKAKDGYLYVNQCVMDHIKMQNRRMSKIKVSYFYNNAEIRTEREVLQFLQLRKKRIRVSQIINDDSQGLFYIYIVDN